MQPNEGEFIPYSPFAKTNQKIMKPLMAPLPKHSRKSRKSQYQQAFETFESSQDEIIYAESMLDVVNSSDYYESENKFGYAPAPLPPRSHHQDMVSNLSTPILQKMKYNSSNKFESQIVNPYLITEYFHQIEAIIESGTSNKRRLISDIIISVNRSLLLTIDSYINFSSKPGDKGELVGMSFDSQLSQTFQQGRFHNGDHILNKLKDEYLEFTLTNNTLMKILKLTKNYCENGYVKYIIMSNVAVAF